MNRECISKSWKVTALFLFAIHISFGQFVESGKIKFERKTNLLKIPNLPPFLKRAAEEKKYKVDEFVLTFDRNGSAFVPITAMTNDPTDMLTAKNTVYSNHGSRERITMLDMMGTKIYITDTVNKIPWKITDNTRKLAGYDCKMAIYHKNDSTRLYAWYAEELIPAVGPETFSGLPGTILGLATEDGGIVYFAKSIDIVKVEDKELKFEPGKNKLYTKAEFAEEISNRMGKSPMIKGMLDLFFRWY